MTKEKQSLDFIANQILIFYPDIVKQKAEKHIMSNLTEYSCTIEIVNLAKFSHRSYYSRPARMTAVAKMIEFFTKIDSSN